jgi:hypothetical protein
MDDMKLGDRMRNLRKSAEDYARTCSKIPLKTGMELVPVTTKEVFSFFKHGIEFDINDPGRLSDSSLTSLLDSDGLARFDIPNDALHLRRKKYNTEILEIIANNAQVNL